MSILLMGMGDNTMATVEHVVDIVLDVDVQCETPVIDVDIEAVSVEVEFDNPTVEVEVEDYV